MPFFSGIRLTALLLGPAAADASPILHHVREAHLIWCLSWLYLGRRPLLQAKPLCRDCSPLEQTFRIIKACAGACLGGHIGGVRGELTCSHRQPAGRSLFPCVADLASSGKGGRGGWAFCRLMTECLGSVAMDKM